MESSITSFREILKQAWSRRVFLIVTTATPPLSPERLTVDYIANLRDPEWEGRERSYHESALSEVNSLVRKYNAMAPYIARRALYTRDAELERLHKESAKEMHERIVSKLSGNEDGPTAFSSGGNGEEEDSINAHGTSPPYLGIWSMIKGLFSWVCSLGIVVEARLNVVQRRRALGAWRSQTDR